MSAYMVILAKINDREAFMAYAVEAAKIIEKFGGKYIVHQPIRSVCLEGNWPNEEKLVISRWPSFEAGISFWNSPEYEKIKKLRLGNSEVKVRLIEVENQ